MNKTQIKGQILEEKGQTQYSAQYCETSLFKLSGINNKKLVTQAVFSTL